MALTVEDGTQIVGSESYVSVADADTYHSNRGQTDWTGTDAVKEQALRLATQYLDGKYRNSWKSGKMARDQALCWPRKAVQDEDGFVYADTQLPPELVDATSEAALISLSEDLSPDLARGGAVKSEKVGSIAIEYSGSASSVTKYLKIERLISHLVRVQGNNALVRA